MRGSKYLLVGLKFLNLLLSVPILVVGIQQSTGANNTECLILIQLPLIVIGISMMLTSLFGLVGAYYQKSILMRLYRIVMLFILLFLVGFTIFAYAVTAKGSGKIGRKIGSCLRNSSVCGKIGRTVDGMPETAAMFFLRKLSPIQSGCCMPPRDCGYVYENGTVWRPVEGVVVGSNPDCTRWSNDQHLLCYDCDSCQDGVLATLKKSWRNISQLVISESASVGVVYIVAYAVYKNNYRRKNNCEPCGQTRMIKLQP